MTITTYIIIGITAVIILLLAAVGVTRPRRRRDLQSHYTEGLDHLLRGNLKQAYQCFKRVIERDTDHVSAYLKLGQVMRQGGAADRALKLHESLLARTNLTTYERMELFKELAMDHSDLGQYVQAVERAQSILKLEKRNAWALRQIVWFCRQLGDWESTGKYLAQWQKAAKKEDTRLLAYCRFRQGYDQREEQSPSAIREHYRQALKIDETFAPAQYFLAKTYADEALAGRRELEATERSDTPTTSKQRQELEEKVAKLYSKAVAYWTAFVESSPGDTHLVLPFVEDTLFYLNRFDDVEPFLQQILEKEPGNLDSVAGLANFYVRRGNVNRAEQLLSTISADAAKSPLIRAIQLKLDYRRASNQNLMPELDRLVDSIRLQANVQIVPPETRRSLMSWLDPSSDPLENLE
ncbi:MAG: tetratricopeptide repeat protein [Fidelibacterota bacterium]|nr:MAG: tetratricopeptide repeat protein [Candidatus Neomarinimicrobiota bacterium]